jgi:hypothetical protein
MGELAKLGRQHQRSILQSEMYADALMTAVLKHASFAVEGASVYVQNTFIAFRLGPQRGWAHQSERGRFRERGRLSRHVTTTSISAARAVRPLAVAGALAISACLGEISLLGLCSATAA